MTDRPAGIHRPNPWYPVGHDAGVNAARAGHHNRIPPAPLGLNPLDTAAWQTGWADGWAETWWEDMCPTDGNDDYR